MPGRVWERFANADFRNKLAVAEQTADKPNFGYGEVNRRSGALGRYQMTRIALQAAGMMDSAGAWTGKYGIHSSDRFLSAPEAQEKALTDYLGDNERQLRANGALGYLGKQIEGGGSCIHSEPRWFDGCRTPRGRAGNIELPEGH
jgi:hypothetical protein